MTSDNHPRAEQAPPRFRAAGIRVISAYSYEDPGKLAHRRIGLMMDARPVWPTVLAVSVSVPDAESFDWDAFLDHLVNETWMDVKYTDLRRHVAARLAMFDDPDPIW